ncbi:anti-sigma factor [Ilumatobacter nonamiensis]|uniref:anti-sigma factor n=1 Tax=Ilumatobacter nonamiensis TaxID=467093 RepID=UPI0003497592|nr:anti-sigma factor [Ilumatobacter nonamiensis]
MPDDPTTNELDELRRLGGAASVEPVEWERPPPELWARIEKAVFADDETVAAPDETRTASDDAVPPPPTSLAAVRDRRRSGWWLASAAAAVFVVAAGAMVWLRSDPAVEVVATVDLEQLGDSGEGTAELIDDDGTLELRLATDGIENADGFAEVWLINSDLTQLVSLGPVRDDETYVLPSGLDPAAFPVVDVSHEPLDGNPEHSGDSVLRGQLTF